ncbi:glycosyltransferase family 2 protein [Sphingobacterium alkalisoli]|uniref:Glycosyltransferase family 2 protein n=1 Tax=Sphingobacterium alkalisoli TaxID=1874115 RepID=A0A4U0GMT4_9SPHI|nr:glycosyltransferase family 2 protein [Sphingobacterium alkalisoli]TJY60160.1 glycosyltransferase family 2 protein [Sphingobacterium alkalisoli]GGH32288.1 glycosyl transferase family 2 [Sphingobacterium alkalisoli]
MITASIVIYNTSEKDLNSLERSFSHVKMAFKLFIVDNSQTNRLKEYFEKDQKIIYIHMPSNPGFGVGHNIAIQEAQKINSQFHFVINPDVYFDTDVISGMLNYINQHDDIGMMMPQILNLDASVQHLPKLLPSPFDVLMRKFKKPVGYYTKFINKYELRFVDHNLIYEAPVLSGCFTLFRMSAIREVGMYDDRFFMYFEDWDLSRRMNEKYRTIYFPKVSVYHGYESGANRNKRLFKIFIQSAVAYFNKWGWIFDSRRRKVNARTLEQF